jgi:hypothetical protein
MRSKCGWVISVQLTCRQWKMVGWVFNSRSSQHSLAKKGEPKRQESCFWGLCPRSRTIHRRRRQTSGSWRTRDSAVCIDKLADAHAKRPRPRWLLRISISISADTSSALDRGLEAHKRMNLASSMPQFSPLIPQSPPAILASAGHAVAGTGTLANTGGRVPHPCKWVLHAMLDIIVNNKISA